MPTNTVIIIDTTYVWDIWFMVVKSLRYNRCIKYKQVVTERLEDYKQLIQELQNEWRTIEAIV